MYEASRIMVRCMTMVSMVFIANIICLEVCGMETLTLYGEIELFLLL